MESNTITIPKKEYEDMIDHIERMKEPIEVLSDEESVRKLKDALERIENMKFFSEDQF